MCFIASRIPLLCGTAELPSASERPPDPEKRGARFISSLLGYACLCLDPGAKQAASQSGRQGPGQNLQVNLHCKRHGSHLAVERLSFLD